MRKNQRDFLPRSAFPGGPAFNDRYLRRRLGEFVATPDGATPTITSDARGLPVT